jgi:hypothetical protein
MSDDDLENDDLEVGDDDETEGLKRQRKMSLKMTAVMRRSDRQRQSQGSGIGR